MKTTLHYIKLVLLSGLLLMALAGKARANTQIIIDSTTLWSSLPVTSATTDILIRNNARLIVDMDAACGSIVIGQFPGAGNLEFESLVPRTLTVNGTVTWGFDDQFANKLNMSSATAQTHKLIIKGALDCFLPVVSRIVPGNPATLFTDYYGTFTAGLGTVEYAGGGQIVSPHSYKNLTLSGSGSKLMYSDSGTVPATEVEVTGKLTISGGAAVDSGSLRPIHYGVFAALEYNSTSSAQVTTDIEFPSTPSIMSVPVRIITSAGVTLNNHKTLSATATLYVAGSLKDAGKTITMASDLTVNGGATHTGTGKILMNTTAPLNVNGSGTIGNLELNNGGAVLFNDSPKIDGRLTLTSGKISLVKNVTTALLTYGGSVRPAGTYGAVASGATTTSDTYFTAGLTGILLVTPLSGSFTSLAANGDTLTAGVIATTYGQQSLTISGVVAGSANGNGPLSGETVTVSIADLTISKTFTFTDNTGVFSVTFDSASATVSQKFGKLSATSGNRTITMVYSGGNNLASKTDTASLALKVNQRAITITADDSHKTYGEKDSAFTYNAKTGLGNMWAVTTGVEQNGEVFTVTIARTSGETVAGSPYTVNVSALKVDGATTGTANYNVTYVAGKLYIDRKGITIAIKATDPGATTIVTKPYGQDVPNLVDYGALIGTVAPENFVVPAQTTTIPAATVSWVTTLGGSTAAPTPTASSPEGSYFFKITVPAAQADPNYQIANGAAVISGTMNITKAQLWIVAKNITKVANGTPYTFTSADVTYRLTANGPDVTTFYGGDTSASFGQSGTLVFSGAAVGATAEGVYLSGIVPSGLVSTKYDIVYVRGTLVLTGAIGTTNLTGDQAWTGGSSLNWQINNAQGTAGANPGWRLLNITGKLNVAQASSGNKYIVNLTTILPGAGNQLAGPMAKFDPTREQQWVFVHTTTGIEGYTSADQFQPNYSGVGFFANPIFGGSFSIVQSGSFDLAIKFTPGTPGSSPVTDILASVNSSDIDVMSLTPTTATTIAPNSTITVDIKVSNLRQPIAGAQAMLKYDSRFFSSDLTKIVAGGGVWTDVIVKVLQGTGEFDVVMGLSFSASSGTQADATIAQITLTPTKQATGASRVIFRNDTTEKITGGITDGTILVSAVDSTTILPARVYTEAITVTVDTTAPVISSVLATQIQPNDAGVLTSRNVKNGPSTDAPVSYTTVRGDVVITVDASDAGVGLSGPPAVVVKDGNKNGAPRATLTTTSTSTPYVYVWTVGSGTPLNTYGVVITATDKIGGTGAQGANASTSTDFSLTVNPIEITGIVELEGWKGGNNTVTFKTGDGTTVTKTLPVSLSFTSGTFLDAGSFPNLLGLAQDLNTAGNLVSRYLTFGAINNLSTLVNKILTGTDGVSAYLRVLWFGQIDTTGGLTKLTTLATSLNTPARTIDAVVRAKLSAGTLSAISSYMAADNAGKAAMANALKTLILIDFNNIALGANLWNVLAFTDASQYTTTSALPLQPATTAQKNLVAALDPQPSLGDSRLVELNRMLLEDAFATGWTWIPEVVANPAANPPVVGVPAHWHVEYNYEAGVLTAQTGASLVAYAGGANSALETLLLQDFNTLTTSGIPLFNEARFLGITLRADTQARVLANPTPTGSNLAVLNRMLLEDAYPGMFTSAKFSPGTVYAITQYLSSQSDGNAIALDAALVSEFNTILTGSLYDATRFAAFTGSFTSELNGLLPTQTGSALVRMNRLLLEAAYSGKISQSVLAAYRISNVPSGTKFVSAKTSNSLREKLLFSAVLDSGNVSATANFVNNRVTGWASTDHYLRGGDCAADNKVNLVDYSYLKTRWQNPGVSLADLNGDGFVNTPDYLLLKANFNTIGDTEVNVNDVP